MTTTEFIQFLLERFSNRMEAPVTAPESTVSLSAYLLITPTKSKAAL